MAQDKRQIHLDPMEWRDAMKDIVKPAKKAPKPRGGRRPKKTASKS